MRIFLDVDGVLADFTMGAHKKLGHTLDYDNWPHAKGPEGWHWERDYGLSFESLSTICDFDFWAALPWTSDGRAILDIACCYGDITLLTAPMPHVMSASGKMAWIKRELPEYSKHTLIATESKAVLARTPDSILVDDNQDNVDGWIRAGGAAVLVPRWWNTAYPRVFEAPKVVKLQLEALKD